MTTTGRSGARRTAGRLLGVAAAAALGLGPLLVPGALPSAGAAGVVPVTTVGESASGVRVELEQVGPTALVPGSSLVVRVLVTNGAATPLDRARVRLFVNSPVLSDRASVAAWAAGEGVQGGDRFTGVDGSELPLGTDLAPGASTEMTFTVAADQLRLDGQFGARGITVDVLDSSLQRLDALRSFVVWMPQGSPPAAAGLTVLAPVVAGPLDVGTGQLPAGVLEPQVAADGRLARVVGSLTASAASLVVDPAVLGPYARPAGDPPSAGGSTPSAGSPSSSPGSSATSSSSSDAPSATTSASPTATDLVQGSDADTSGSAQSWRSEVLARTAGGLSVLPRGDLDVAGAVGTGTEDLLPLAVAQSTSSATAASGRPPSAQLLWPRAQVSAAGLVLASASAATPGDAPPAVVLDAAAVSGAVSAQGTSLPVVTATTTTGATTTAAPAVLVDSTDSALLAAATQPTSPGAVDPAEASARLLADTAVAASVNAAGTGAGQQGLVLALPRSWDPDPAAASDVLVPVSSAPWVRSTPLVDLLASATTTSLPVADGATTPSAPEDASPLPADGLEQAQAAVSAVRTAGALVPDRSALQQPVEASAVAAASAGWVDQQDAWRTGLSSLAARAIELRGAVAVVSGSRLVVVTHNVELPVSVRNDLPQSATVWVSVRSTSLRLQPGEAQQVVVPAGSTETVRLPVKAVASGDLDLRVVMTDEAGQPVGDPVGLRVRVHADWERRGVAIAVAVVVLVFLGGVVRTVVRVRRRPAPPVVRSAEEVDGDGSATRRPEESTRG